MSKMKTVGAFAKRFKVKKAKTINGKKVRKIMKRTDGQDHFNARENGKTRRNKRSDKTVSPRIQKTILRAIPHA